MSILLLSLMLTSCTFAKIPNGSIFHTMGVAEVKYCEEYAKVAVENPILMPPIVEVPEPEVTKFKVGPPYTGQFNDYVKHIQAAGNAQRAAGYSISVNLPPAAPVPTRKCIYAKSEGFTGWDKLDLAITGFLSWITGGAINF